MEQEPTTRTATEAGAAGGDDLAVTYLAQGEQRPEEVAGLLADFLRGATQSIDMAVYDFRLSDPLKAILAGALSERAQAGVQIRIAYDAGNSAEGTSVPHLAQRAPQEPTDTQRFVESLGYPSRAVGGMKLMHSKYIIVDGGTPAAAIWTGSTNLTDDALTLQENNIVRLRSAALAANYERDFAQLWQRGNLEHTGNFDTAPATLRYRGADAGVDVDFAPGRGEQIDERIGQLVAGAMRRVRLCTMLINSTAFINALTAQVERGAVELSGVYDRTQMEGVYPQWAQLPQNQWKVAAVQQIIARAGLVGKDSTPYAPGRPHDFMHNKVLVLDDTVVTGSYNFSHSAEQNAENVLFIESAALADEYARYIDHLMQKYGGR